MRFGAHVSSSGGISNAIERAVAIGCETLQVFTHNPGPGDPPNTQMNRSPLSATARRSMALGQW